jgi:hypothetical protein
VEVTGEWPVLMIRPTLWASPAVPSILPAEIQRYTSHVAWCLDTSQPLTTAIVHF